MNNEKRRYYSLNEPEYDSKRFVAIKQRNMLYIIALIIVRPRFEFAHIFMFVIVIVFFNAFYNY